MYHRFNESKYPSTNIQMDIFEKHIDLINKSNFAFHHPKDFENNFNSYKERKKILLTIDDAFKSFYTEAWPFLKKK
jgi:peptidoglycan/xylan/chitin deacetylase (PgdA/CDA1 family)